jgi:sugar phosphate isomerase/epimerase
MVTDIADRIGIDIGSRLSPEEGLQWAADNGIPHIDMRLDEIRLIESDVLDERADGIRELAEENDIDFGLHTLSAVNVAEISPFVDRGSDDYMNAYVDAAERLGAGWIVVHGGYHFSKYPQRRIDAAIERLERTLDRAAEAGVDLYLENHNPEPDDAEMHYLPVKLEDCVTFFEALDGAENSDHLHWTFNVAHANIAPQGIEGYAEELGIDRAREVRVNDNNGTVEEHLPIGEGNIDFADTLDLIEGEGYDGKYTLSYTTVEEMLEGREKLIDIREGQVA